MPDSQIIVSFVFRWLHFIFGILWIGHLYFFNFVNANVQLTLDAATKQKVVPELMPRALFWFRWGAMITFVTGLSLIGHNYKIYLNSYNGYLLLFGAALGTIMWFNVWFIIWPSQKKIIRAVKAGEKPDPEKVELARKASKLNTFLSIPMLFGMAAGSHLPVSDMKYVVIVGLGAVVIGFIIAQLLFKMAPKVGKTI